MKKFAIGAALAALLVIAAMPAGATPVRGKAAQAQTTKFLRSLKDSHATKSFWQSAAKPNLHGRRVVHARHLRTLRLSTAKLRKVLASAPKERTRAGRRH